MLTPDLKTPTSSAPSATDTAEPGLLAKAPESGADTEVDAAEASPEVDAQRTRSWPGMTPPRLALVIGLVMAASLAALIGVLGVQSYHAYQSAQLRALYLQVARQGAVNLTTIDWHHADADVQRILGSATGWFHDDFSQRSASFIDVVKKVQSISTGTISVAGLESSTDNDAQVLVAVNVKTTTSEAPQQAPRAWRMRISLQKVGKDVKVSHVEFVP
ncbi:Mce associated membrane protein [soil metagenome]